MFQLHMRGVAPKYTIVGMNVAEMDFNWFMNSRGPNTQPLNQCRHQEA